MNNLFRMYRILFHITAMTVVLSACTTTKETALLYDDIYYTGKSVKKERNDSIKTTSQKDAFMEKNQPGKDDDFIEEHQGDEDLAFMEENRLSKEFGPLEESQASKDVGPLEESQASKDGSPMKENQPGKEDPCIAQNQDSAEDASLKKDQASQPDTLIEEIQASNQDSLVDRPLTEYGMENNYSYTSRIIRFHRDFTDFYYFHPIILNTGFYVDNYSFIIDFLVYSPDYSPTYAEDIEKAAEAYEGFGLHRHYKPCGTPDEMFKTFR